jgi:CheY-like chemotaxis protein
MNKDVQILIAEDNEGHFSLIKKNLRRTGIQNKIVHFVNGQETLDFLFHESRRKEKEIERRYVLLLDIRMPKVDGLEVLKKIKSTPDLKRLPIIMMTTSTTPSDIDRCYELGCNIYIIKPIEYENFSDALRKVGFFFSVIEAPNAGNEVQ